MNKSDLMNTIAAQVTHIPAKDVELLINTIFDCMSESLQKGQRIELRGFGTFEIRERQPRQGRNPKTGLKVQVGLRRVPFFKVGKELKDRVNHP